MEEIVLSGTLAKCGWRPFYRKAEKKLAEEKMKRMEVWKLRKSCYRNLSGGQQQRTLLARALCAASKVILLDEPVTGLDPKVTAEFYQVTKDLSEEGIAVIMVSHDVQALDYATHILHMQKKNVSVLMLPQVMKNTKQSELRQSMHTAQMDKINKKKVPVKYVSFFIASYPVFLCIFKLVNNTIFIMPVTIAAAILLLRTGQNTKIKGDAAIAMLSVSSLAVGYLVMNLFSTSAKIRL